MPDGKVNLAERIGVSYMKFGVLLLEDDTGGKVNAIEHQLQCNAEKINFRLLQLWLQGQGRQPVTWATLVAVLQDIGLVKLAKEIKAAKM